MSVDDNAEQTRLRIARDLAYEEGRRREKVDGRLNSHEARLNAINGSIDRAAGATNALRLDVQKLHEEVTRLADSQETRDAVERAREEQLRKANEKQISNRTFWVGVAMILVTLAVGLVAQAHLFSGVILGGF